MYEQSACLRRVWYNGDQQARYNGILAAGAMVGGEPTAVRKGERGERRAVCLREQTGPEADAETVSEEKPEAMVLSALSFRRRQG